MAKKTGRRTMHVVTDAAGKILAIVGGPIQRREASPAVTEKLNLVVKPLPGQIVHEIAIPPELMKLKDTNSLYQWARLHYVKMDSKPLLMPYATSAKPSK